VPEGHTLHRLATALDTAFAGRDVRVSSPQGRFDAGAALVDGHTVAGASAHGKHLFVDFDHGPVWHVHLGLIGKFVVVACTDAAALPDPVGAVRARISDEGHLGDLRGPQTCEVLDPDEVAQIVGRLGPDPLREDADPDRGWERVHRSRKPVAALLMDQSVLSGIGNVYRAEVLFRNRIDPHRRGTELKRASWRAIWADLEHLMPIGVSRGSIDTLRDEHLPEADGSAPGMVGHGGEVYVYRRTGMPCRVCGSRIRTEVLEGRNLFWCGRCQRRG